MIKYINKLPQLLTLIHRLCTVCHFKMTNILFLLATANEYTGYTEEHLLGGITKSR